MGVGMSMSFYGLPVWGLVTISVWELIWKGIALWKGARKNQFYWYLAILIFNTVGILPIIYLLFFQKKTRRISSRRKTVKKKTKKKAKKTKKKRRR